MQQLLDSAAAYAKSLLVFFARISALHGWPLVLCRRPSSSRQVPWHFKVLLCWRQQMKGGAPFQFVVQCMAGWERRVQRITPSLGKA
jgi:hypothetical protein